MRRVFVVLAAAALALGLAAPAVLAAQPPFQHTGTVLMSFNGDVTVPAGESADSVFVVTGTATIRGTVETVIVLDGAAVLEGASVHSLFVTGGSVSIDGASTVTGDVRTLGATATVDPAATVGGTVSGLESDLVAAGAILAPAILLFMLGLALVTIVSGLALAALAARQVRSAEGLMDTEPVRTFVVGVAGLVVIPVVAILAVVTVVGAPLGLAILLVVWPAAAVAGYLVAGIWIGEWLLERVSPRERPARPYLAAVVGLIVLPMISIVPFVGAIASLFGFGAVLLLAWRTFRQPSAPRPVTSPPATQPMGA
jgi:hypothetical protein